MRLLAALLLALALLTGCSDGSDPASDPGTSPGEERPEDTLPVLGRWTSEPLESGQTVILTLSDDNTYVAENECLELTGRWELTGGEVVLTPDDGGTQCGEDVGAPVELPPALTVDGDQLVPQGVGPTFTKD
ncbi:hypothetical protein IDH50_16680 [Aeromicrobium tamlense]|uniref:META domain-containing protein n=1 Tax=Aeromicrobium tamlense TaxID=375541 RepID=A0A8I0KN54_9ACTN|nr:hypothetical protein [Aeromicrobium tamlense]MBD1271883.1 hypothetical protein [Aeromicrobium tamlense]NYI38927.1 hypothetical protein [Aeromicrobium tamlense]